MGRTVRYRTYSTSSWLVETKRVTYCCIWMFSVKLPYNKCIRPRTANTTALWSTCLAVATTVKNTLEEKEKCGTQWNFFFLRKISDEVFVGIVDWCWISLGEVWLNAFTSTGPEQLVSRISLEDEKSPPTANDEIPTCYPKDKKFYLKNIFHYHWRRLFNGKCHFKILAFGLIDTEF